MEKEFVPYDIALELQKLGFNEITLCVYNSYQHLKGKIVSSIDGDYIQYDKHDDRLPAPTYSQTFRWLREKHDLLSHIEKGVNPNNYYPVINNVSHRHNPRLWFNSYEEAELTCLIELIKIVKQ